MSLQEGSGASVLSALLCCFLLFAGCAGPSREDKELTKLSKEFLEDYFKAHPVSATRIGEHRYDGQIDDMSPEAKVAEGERLNTYLARLKGIDHEKLSQDNRIDAEILRSRMEGKLLSLRELRGWERNPLVYTQLLGNSIYLLIARDFAPFDKRLDSVIKRLKLFPRMVDQAMANLKNPPKIHTETAINQNRGTVALLEGDLRREAEKIPRKGKDLEKALEPALEALQRFQEFLEKDLFFRSKGDFRLGDRLYRKKLKLTLMSPMSSEEIVDRARIEMEKLHGEMYELAAPIYAEMFPGEPVKVESKEDRKHVIKTVLDEISRDHPDPADLLDACRNANDEAAAFVREKGIITLPKEPLEIIWAPEFSRGVAVAGLRSPGPLDREMKAFYVVSPVPDEWTPDQVDSYLREYNNEMIRILTIHEAMPGHYVQLAYSNRFPSLVRAVFSSGTFVEGWAMYSERMMLEEGFRGGDPKLWLQRKKFYLRAVINALLDPGIHRGGMTEYEAMKLMIEEGFQEESEASGKWRRACLTSSQLSTYFVGYKEVTALREDAEKQWGKKFKLGEFHEKLLSYGSPPTRFVREILLED